MYGPSIIMHYVICLFQTNLTETINIKLAGTRGFIHTILSQHLKINLTIVEMFLKSYRYVFPCWQLYNINMLKEF